MRKSLENHWKNSCKLRKTGTPVFFVSKSEFEFTFWDTYKKQPLLRETVKITKKINVYLLIFTGNSRNLAVSPVNTIGSFLP